MIGRVKRQSGSEATKHPVLDVYKRQTVSAPRSMMTYSNRFTEEGTQMLVLKAGPTGYTLRSDVGESGIDISEATYGLAVKLDAAGRSNGESNPGTCLLYTSRCV